MASRKFLVPANLLNLASDPASGTSGDIYFNTTSDKLKVYDGTAWVEVGSGGGSAITVSDTAPASPTTGDAWYDNTDGSFYVYDGSFWVEVNGVIAAAESFKTISVSGQSDIVADTTTDTLTFVAGTNVSITTNATNDSITINSTGNYTSVDSITYPDYITFDTTPETVPTAAGSLYWDSGDGLPATVLNANVSIGLGQEQVALVKNATGASIAKGKVVYINGAQGQRPTITLSDADSETTSSKTFGVTAEAIADGAEGFVTTFGVLRGVNTDGLTEGAALWLSSTAGGYSTSIPAEPAHSVFIGYVVKAHASSGEIFVNIQNGYELNELHGVLIDGTPADNEVLAYDDFSGLWKNQTAVEAGLLDTSATEQTKAGNLIITGNLTVNGTTTTINSTAINVNNQVIFEGPTPDNFETTLTSIDPTADNTISLPNASGTIALQGGYTHGSVINIRSYDGITDGAINLEAYLNKIQLSDDDGITITSGAGTKAFIFNNSGNITLPGNILFTDSSSQSTAFLGMSSYSTTNLSEGSNLYYTDERAQDAVGNNVGTGLSYNDSTGAISNSGVTGLTGTTNEIVVSGSTGSITIGIPDSPVFVTPNIGVATATSINGTTIPSSKTLVVTTDIGSTVQAYDADLGAIAALTGTSGILTTNGSGTWSIDTNTYSTTSHNHTLNSLSNVVITGTPSDGQALVWDTTTSKWINETISAGDAFPTQTGNTGKFLQTDGSTVSWQNVNLTNYVTLNGTETLTNKKFEDYLEFSIPSSSVGGTVGVDSFYENFEITSFISDLKLIAANQYGSVVLSGQSGEYLNSYHPNNQIATIGDLTLEAVTDGGASSTNAISITNSTAASSPTTGALIVTGGVGIGEDLYVDNDVYVGGNINITGTITGDLTSIDVTNLVVTDPLIYLAEGNPDDSVDIGIFAALNHGGPSYSHTGLIRDASDSGKWKLASGLADPTSNVINFTGATFDTLKIGALEVTDASTTRTNLGLAIGTDVQAYNSTLAAVAGGTYTGDDSITTVGTISSGTWSGTAIGYTKGGTGLTTLGTAGQALKVNATADGLEWGTVSGGGGSSAAAVTSSPPSTPELNQVWQDLDTGRIYIWNGTFWIEVQSNGSLGLLRYLGASATAPSTSIDGSALGVGEVYFDTVFNAMKVYDGTAWEDAFSAASLSVGRWVKVMSGGQTSLSGNDDNSVALSYTAGIEEVYLNGVKLIRGSDYIATTGTTITNLEPITAGSVVEVISYSGFTVANTYTKTEVDNMLAKQAVRWTEVAPIGSSITTLSGADDYANTLAYTPGTELVYINGILIARGIDYTASNGTSVVLATALVPGDIVEIIGNTTFSVANTYTKAEVDVKLNTLTSPTINGTTSAAGNINPSATNTYDLGTTSLRWRNIYTQDLHLSNGIGDYTVVEGEEDLFLVNNKSGKSFKFALIEVDPSQVPPKSESN